MPDIWTGQPRPPRAPVRDKLKWEKREKGKYPPAPDGEGSLLEWFHGTSSGGIPAGILVSILGIIFLCLRDWGFDWMSTWWLWLLVMWPPFVWPFLGNSYGISAGADWFAVKKGYVKTYELTDVKVVGASGGLAWDIELKDKRGVELVNINLRDIQANRDLWDLVYNGILYSVHKGAATANGRALDMLDLR